MKTTDDRVMIRQGDVLLVPVGPPTDPQRVLDAAGQPLAGLRVEGERTGHAHVLPARVYDDVGRRLLFLERPEEITHQEHGALPVAAGWWEIRVQREHIPERAPTRRWD